jgi:hypothetical protein
VQADIDRLSAAAFHAAKEAAVSGVTPELRERVDRLVVEIDRLRRGADDPRVEQQLADAVLDVDWVRSNCMLPTSTRLHWFLEEQEAEPPAT